MHTDNVVMKIPGILHGGEGTMHLQLFCSLSLTYILTLLAPDLQTTLLISAVHIVLLITAAHIIVILICYKIW